MRRSDALAHLADTFRWSAQPALDPVGVLAAAIGIAGPVLLGVATGNLPSGLAAALGGLMVGRVGDRQDLRGRVGGLLTTLAPALAAAATAVLIPHRGWPGDTAVILLAGAAATIGGYSRDAAAAAMRFVPYLIITVAIAETAGNRTTLALLIVAGALWAAVATVLLGVLDHAFRRADTISADDGLRRPTAAQKAIRWRRSLAGLDGWQYPLRLVACLAVAIGLRHLWPEHHLHWIALTVALLTERTVAAFPVRTTQRAIGTALGVLVASPLVVFTLPPWGLAFGLALAAVAWSLLRARSYLAYSIVMTPVIITIMDAGRAPDAGVLADRLVATLLGAALVIVANFAARRLVGSPPPGKAGNGRR